MGIVNVTPDSFSDGGTLYMPQKSFQFSGQLTVLYRWLKQGAAFIDIGGESTRPGATPVGLDEEMNRVLAGG